MNFARACNFLILLLSSASQWRLSTAQTVCRDEKLAPHQASIWQNQFPFDLDSLPVGLCDGTIEIQSDGGMCVTGKVTYGQLQEASGEDRPIYQLTAEEVSINGHMTGGSGYVWLGPQVFYLYDFITSYIVEGKTYPNDASIVNNLLAASRGAIDGVCLSAAFRQVPRSYRITHKVGLVTKKPFSRKKIKNSSYTFISRYFVVYESHEWKGNDNQVFGFGELSYGISNFLTGVVNTVSMPDITSDGSGALGFIPLNVFAPLARLLVFGTVSTKNFPVPVSAPDDITESIQIDTEYSTLLTALEDGLFSSKSIPLYFYIRFKRVEPFEGTNACFKESAAILEITAPQQDGENLDAWVDEVVTPALLAAGGTIGLHFGKRIPPNSATLQAALDKYASCGAEVNLSPTNCYHPQCSRKISPDTFTYPPAYYSSDLSHAARSHESESESVSTSADGFSP